MADRLAASGASIHAVVVARGGRLVFERYFKGDEQVPGRFFGHRLENLTFDADTLHNMKSVSKSVMSLALGIAVDRGLIRSVNEPIFNFFPELSDLRTPEKDRIQLVHVLTMSMGLKWVEATPATGDYDNDEARMHMASDQCRYVLGLPVTAPAGQEFFYNTGALALVSAVIRKATGQPVDEFIRVNLFEPLGITRAEWERYRGEADTGGGLHLRPRDMAKIGQLVLAGGRWNDRQIVSKEWIEASTTSKLKATRTVSLMDICGGSAAHGPMDVSSTGSARLAGADSRSASSRSSISSSLVTGGYYEDYSPRAFGSSVRRVQGCLAGGGRVGRISLALPSDPHDLLRNLHLRRSRFCKYA